MHIIIICNYDTASALMSQASYSDRPILTMVGDLYVGARALSLSFSPLRARMELWLTTINSVSSQDEFYTEHCACAIWGTLEGDASHHAAESQPHILAHVPPQPANGRTSAPPGAPRPSRQLHRCHSIVRDATRLFTLSPRELRVLTTCFFFVARLAKTSSRIRMASGSPLPIPRHVSLLSFFSVV